MASRQFRSDDTSKWKESFGNGSDGDLVISADTIDTPIDASCSGTEGQFTLVATNVNFVAGQCLLIHQARGTGAGFWEYNKILSYTAGTITLKYALCNTYTDSGNSQAQALVLKQYKSVTINSTKILTAKAWNGDVDGILSFLCNGIITVNGTISANGLPGTQNPTQHGYGEHAPGGEGIGFWGGDGYVQYESAGVGAWQGESELKDGAYSPALGAANGGGGGGPRHDGETDDLAGGGASYATEGSQAATAPNPNDHNGKKGIIYGVNDLTSLYLGSGGGGSYQRQNWAGGGGGGGGIILITAKKIECSSGTITANGGAGVGQPIPSSGCGSGGSILLKAEIATLGSGITATGGTGGNTGGHGRIHLDYRISKSGTTSPTLDSRQDYTIKKLILPASMI